VLDREKIQKDFKIKKLNKKGKTVEVNISDGILNCLDMGILFLYNEEDVEKFTPEMLTDFIEAIVDIWKPEGDEKAEQMKKETVPELEKILSGLQKNIKKYLMAETEVEEATYENVKPLFEEWQKYINKKLYKNMDLKLANPFLTVSIAKTLGKGIAFQNSQKITRRAVTEWGGQFEGAFAIFNPKMKTLHAGRMDVKAYTTLYDIKSGPNVLQLGQVDGINKKISLIAELKKKSFGKFIEITSYKVAIIYGRWELRNSYMKKIRDGGLVIGPDTWKELTGDDWNAFKLFIWQIRYGIVELNKKWVSADLKKAVKIFLNSFYGDVNLLKEKHVKLENDVKKILEKIKKKEEEIERLTNQKEPDGKRIAARKSEVDKLKEKLKKLEGDVQQTEVYLTKRKRCDDKGEKDPDFKNVEKLISKTK